MTKKILVQADPLQYNIIHDYVMTSVLFYSFVARHENLHIPYEFKSPKSIKHGQFQLKLNQKQCITLNITISEYRL